MEQNPTNHQEQSNEDIISNYMDEMALADIEFHQSVVKKARNALFLAAVLIFLGEMISMFKDSGAFDITIFIIALVEAGIFVGLALWTKRKPYSAIVGGLIAFIGIHLLAMAVNGYVDGIDAALLSLMSGFIFKIFILAALFNALRNAKELQNIQRKGL